MVIVTTRKDGENHRDCYNAQCFLLVCKSTKMVKSDLI